MNLKKFAIRGIIVLAIFVALCMFFSGTIKTITTAKVKLTAGRRGKLEEKTQLVGKLAYSQTDDITVELPSETTLTITKLNTRVGYSVKAGDVLAQASVTNYDQALKAYQATYDQTLEQLLTLENKNRDIRINKRDEQYAESYYALRDAKLATTACDMELGTLLKQEKLTLPDSGYPENASEELIAAIDAWRQAAQAEAEAQQAMETASRYSVEDAVWTYISERRTCQDKMAAAEEGMRTLMALNRSAQSICAPHDGYVASLNVKVGDNYDGSQPIASITKEGEMPVLRADVTQVSRVVTEGTVVTMNSDRYDPIETKVVANGIDAEGKKYVDIAVTDQIINACGSIYAMSMDEVPLTLLYRSKDNTTLLPSSAVFGSGEDRYVYIVEQSASSFGDLTMKLRKVEVTVLAESSGVTSVQEDITYNTLAYMEDRPISDGDAVMEYIS